MINSHHKILLCFIWLSLATSVMAQRQMESLGRGVVAVRTGASSAYIGWRLLGTDPDNVGFNLFRVTSGATNKLNVNLLTNTTDYVDGAVNFASANSYFVQPVVGVVTQAVSAAFTLPASAPTQQYLNIALQQPPGGVAYDGVPYTYSPNDCSAGDVDGDGEYEIILKWDPSNAQDNSFDGFTGNTILDCYKLDGTRLWRIDLGPNIRSGAHYMDFMVFDFDGDGRSEVMCRTAPGTRDGGSNYVGSVAKWQNANGARPTFNNTDDYRFNNPNNVTNGYVLAGPEFLSVFNGLTGVELATSTYYPKRDPDNNNDNPTASRINTVWGDSYGNRLDRFLAGVAYVDGQRPSGIFCRGYYTRAYLAAWDWRNGALSLRWTFASDPSNTAYRGQGAHSLTIGDADGDGKDEIIYGAAAIDDDGTGLYSTGLGHGDALHFSDMNPWRPGLEVWMVHEDPGSYGPNGLEFRDAGTGSLIFGVSGEGTDVGRGVAFDLDPRYPGYEMWGSRGGMMSATGVQITSSKSSQNFCVWWDADLLREPLDDTTISKWNWNTASGSTLLSPAGIDSNNGTKATPNLSADLFGDWREEVIWRTTDNLNLRIYTTTTTATNRIPTLMHDPQYRCAIAWQNTGYNQPPHPGYFLGADMFTPPLAPISLANLVWRGGSSNVWDAGSTANWRTNGVWTNANPATVFNAGNAVLFDFTGSNNAPVSLVGSLMPAEVRVHAAKDFTFSGAGELAGAMSLVKAGPGALTVANTNSFTGETAVSDGTLRVNGALLNSPVTARWPGAVGGAGRMDGGITLQRGARVEPGAAPNVAGTLTVSNALLFRGEAVARFDLSDDATGVIKTNDRLVVAGNLSLSGTNTLEINRLNGTLGVGAYNLISYSGALTGSLANLTISGMAGEIFYLTNTPGFISLVLPAYRAPTNLTWVGGGANLWDLASSTSWTDGGSAQLFYPGDAVRFDNAGSATANVVGLVQPASLTVDRTTDLTLTGTGSIIGSGGLTKSNTATLILNTPTNGYTGRTLLAGGVVTVTNLASGGWPSAIGAASAASSNLVFAGGTLRYSGGTVTTDRGATLNSGGATFEVTSGSVNLTLSGVFTGAGSLTKLGAGTLTIGGGNNYTGGTIIRAGTVVLGSAAANNSGLGTGSVTFTNGALLNMFASSSGDTSAGTPNNNAFIVPTNGTGTLYMPFRMRMNGSLTGGGTFNVRCNGSRNEFYGDWSAFTGQINITSRTGTSDFRCNNSVGYPNARLDLAVGTTLQNRISGTPTISIGELSGDAGSALTATGGSDGLGVNWSVGGLNTSAIFDGHIQNNVGLIKVGTGTWTLNGARSNTAPTTVNAGTLLLNGNGSTATSVVTVGAAGTLGGTGTVGGVATVNGALSPGAAGLGTLTFDSSLNLAAGSTTLIEIRKTPFANDQVAVGGTLTLGGALVVTNLAGTLSDGDSFQILAAGAVVGAFSSTNLPPLGGGLVWITTNLNTTGILSVAGTNSIARPANLIWRGNGAANGWDVNATSNWIAPGNVLGTFVNGDRVTFDDTGSNNVPVALVGTVQPARVHFAATKNYTLGGTGSLAGTNALFKSGSGTLTITATNLHAGGTFLTNGIVALSGPAAGGVTANNFALGGGPVTFLGGTLQMYGYGLADNTSSFGSLTNDLVVPAGQSGTLRTGPRQTVGSRLTGAGTLNLNVEYVRGNVSGDWSAFTGLIVVSNTTGTPPSGTVDDFRVANAAGFPNARIVLGPNVALYSQAATDSVIPMGELSAPATGLMLAAGGSGAGAQNPVTWRVGGLNTSTTNAASIRGATSLIKEGAGTWTLTGTNSHTGSNFVAAGALRVNNASESGTGVGSLIVANGATLTGNGFIGSPTTLNAGARLSPGDAVGTLTFNSNLTLNATSVLNFELGASNASDRVSVAGPLVLGGTLNVTNLAGFASGSYPLFTYAGGLSGSLPTLGSMPAGYAFSVSTNTPGEVRLSVQVTATPGISNVVLTSGQLVLSGSGGPPNGLFHMLTATNVTVPLAQWTALSTNQFNALGGFTVSNAVDPTQVGRYYRLRLP
jgi:autotransporter-associated beta strand protein